MRGPRDTVASPSQLERRGTTDDGLGAIGLFAPDLDLGTRAFSFGASVDNPTLRAGSFLRPQDIDQAQIELAADDEPEAKVASHHLRDQAYGEHPLHDNLRKAELPRRVG